MKTWRLYLGVWQWLDGDGLSTSAYGGTRFSGDSGGDGSGSRFSYGDGSGEPPGTRVEYGKVCTGDGEGLARVLREVIT